MSDRYSRQVLFRGIGEQGQERIRQSRIAIVGCGALGTVGAEMLTRSGVARLTVIDRDFVEESNLQRQSLFTEAMAREGLPKAVAAQRSLREINSEVQVEGVVADVHWQNIERLCADCDLILDGTDNFETRFLINDFSVKNTLPWVYGGCLGSYGVAYAFQPGATACLACLFPPPSQVGETETCDTAGVLASVVHVVAAHQVTQALRLLVGVPPHPDILQVDLWSGSWRTIPAKRARQPDCRCCQKRDFAYLEGRQGTQVARLCGRDAIQLAPQLRGDPDFDQIAQRLDKSVHIDRNPYLLRIRVDHYEIALFTDGRSIIRGAADFSEARAVYARYIGS